MNKKAFTLIELLVVIAILGMLMFLLLPVMGRTRGAARRVQCISNLRQHGIAWYLYLDDHDYRFPTENLTAHQKLYPYLDIEDESSPSAEIFHCPNDKPDPRINQTTFDVRGSSYWFPNSIAGMPLSQITNPHDKVCLERDHPSNEPGHGEYGLFMVLFVDGHVAGPYSAADWGVKIFKHPTDPYLRP